jgi:hypothetical protein
MTKGLGMSNLAALGAFSVGAPFKSIDLSIPAP